MNNDYSDLEEKEIVEKIKEYHYLINREQAKYLISIEKNLNFSKQKNLEEVKKSFFPFEIEVEVKKVYLLQKTIKNKQTFNTLRILVSDESGEATIVFFDNAALEVWQKIMAGDRILIGPLKKFNDEFRMLSQGKIRLIKKAPTITDPKEGMKGNFEGTVEKVVDKKYKTKNGETGIMSSFYININKKKYEVVYWKSEGLKNLLKDGINVRIENGYLKNNQIWLNSNSRLLFQPSKRKKIKIKNFVFEENKIIIEGEKEKIVFEKMQDLAALLGLKNLSEDIDLKKILHIKLSYMIGKNLIVNN